MGDDHHRQALLGEVAHYAEHFADHLGVEGARRLVKEQHFRLHCKGAGDRHSLLLTARELSGLRIDERLHADLAEIFHRRLLRLGVAALEDGDLADDAVFQRRHIVEKVEALEHHADLGAVLREVEIPVSNILAVEEYIAGGGSLEQVDAAQHRALAGAGGADYAEHFALADAQVDITQHEMIAELLLQMGKLYHSVRHYSASFLICISASTSV